jgi:hypothetical protein
LLVLIGNGRVNWGRVKPMSGQKEKMFANKRPGHWNVDLIEDSSLV